MKADRIGGVPHRRAKTVMMESFLVAPGADPEREGAREHTRAWVDEPIDMLGMTPREAARAGGRARDGLEIGTASSPRHSTTSSPATARG